MYNTAKPADPKDTGIVRGTKKSAVVVADFLYVARDAKDIISASKKNSVHLVVEPEPQPLLVSVDKSRVYEVIANLLGNAIKFTNDGNITISTEKKKYGGKDYALVTVKDQGARIDPEMLPRLFTKLASKSQQDTGLGLFIARGIVEAHGKNMERE